MCFVSESEKKECVVMQDGVEGFYACQLVWGGGLVDGI